MTTHLDTPTPAPTPPAGAQPLPQPTPLQQRLPQLGSATISLRNRAYAAPASLLGDGRVLIWQGSSHFLAQGELSCRLAGLPFLLAADNLSVLEPRLKGFESFVPSEACTALVEHALAPVIDLIEKLAGGPVECDEYKKSPAHAPACGNPGQGTDGAVTLGFLLMGHGMQTIARGWMRATPAVWRCLDFARTPAAPTQRHHAVPVNLSVQLGRCRLPLVELRDLAPGDALRITPCVARQAQGLPVQLVDASGRHSCRARLMGDYFVLETTMSNTMDIPSPSSTSSRPPSAAPVPPQQGNTQGNNPMPSMQPATPSPASGLTAGGHAAEDFLTAVECELTFELGSMRLTVAEIARLRVGQSLRLGARLQEQPVRILASGRQIARGELAAVGDELVVVVTETGGLPLV